MKKRIYYAVVGMYNKDGVFHWPETYKHDGELMSLEQCDIFLTKRDALKAKKVWDKNWGGRIRVIPVHILLVKGKKKPHAKS